jgi:hypothetical protein
VLTTDINIKDFMHCYWLRAELEAFCEEQRISKEGNKNEIEERIKVFLKKKVS